MALRALFAALAVLLVFVPGFAQAEGDPPEDVYRYFEEENGAVTPLRRAAPTGDSPVAVDVVTADEIKASGAIDLWDLLRFRTGIDVVEGRSLAGSNRGVVSVRGIPRDTVSELLVLVDGRSVYSPVSGSVLWAQLPVQIQDIDRIEIVRGPNAALYGSNAGLGVIHIITKRPSRKLGASAGALGGGLSTRQGEGALEAGAASWGARMSGTWRAQDGAPSATPPHSEGHDFFRDGRGNARLLGRPWSGGLIEGFAGWSRQELGKSFGSRRQGHYRSDFQMFRLETRPDDDSLIELRASRDQFLGVETPGVSNSHDESLNRQYEAEALHSFAWWGGKMTSTYGIGWRYAQAESNYLYRGARPINRTVRGYLHQSIRLGENWEVLGGLNHETANIGGYHKDFQGALLWRPIEDHSLRAAYSRANIKPQILHRHSDFNPNAFVSIVGNRNLSPSPLTNYEAGWTGLFAERALRLELTGFYTEIRDHHNLDTIATGLPTVMTYDNTNTVVLRGFEASGRWRWALGRSVYANFTRETVSDQDAHRIYVDTTPKHKVNLGFDAVLKWGLRASMNAGWKDGYLADSVSGTAQEAVPAFWRLDARLGWMPVAGCELFVAGKNLLAPTKREFIDGLLAPRTVLVGASVKY